MRRPICQGSDALLTARGLYFNMVHAAKLKPLGHLPSDFDWDLLDVLVALANSLPCFDGLLP